MKLTIFGMRGHVFESGGWRPSGKLLFGDRSGWHGVEPLRIAITTSLDCKKTLLNIKLHSFLDVIGNLLHDIMH